MNPQLFILHIYLQQVKFMHEYGNFSLIPFILKIFVVFLSRQKRHFTFLRAKR